MVDLSDFSKDFNDVIADFICKADLDENEKKYFAYLWIENEFKRKDIPEPLKGLVAELLSPRNVLPQRSISKMRTKYKYLEIRAANNAIEDIKKRNPLSLKPDSFRDTDKIGFLSKHLAENSLHSIPDQDPAEEKGFGRTIIDSAIYGKDHPLEYFQKEDPTEALYHCYYFYHYSKLIESLKNPEK